MNTTILPTTKYKNSPLGLIPEDWEVKTVAEAFEICNNLRFPISEIERKKIKGTYPYYGPTKIQDYINEYRVNGKYTLIGEDGDHFLKWKELPMTLLIEGKFNVNNHAHLIQGKENLTEWFFYYFNNKELTPHLTRQGAGRYKLTKKALGEMLCPIPFIEEQTAIVNCLCTWDQAIEKQTTLIAQKELSKKALMQHLLSGKKRLKGFADEWKIIELKEICKINKGEQYNKDELDKIGKYPSYSGGIQPSGYTDKWNTSEDTIIISEGGNSCGYVNFICTKFWCGGHCYAMLNIKDNISKMFLYQTLKYNEHKIMKLRVGSGLPNVQKKDLEKFCLLIPSNEEQIAIANVLQCADNEIQLLKKKLDQLEEQKKGLMQVLLTGKKRLKF